MTRTRAISGGAIVALLAVAVALPYIGATSYVISLVSTILIAGMLASSLNFLVGDAGMASLGHGAIAAAAAYGAGWASKQGLDPGTQVLIALGITLVVSFMYGILSMRTSGIYFLMVTLALGMVVYGLAFRLVAGHRRRERHLRHQATRVHRGVLDLLLLRLVAAFVLTTALLCGGQPLAVRREPARYPGQRDAHAQPRATLCPPTGSARS